MHLPNTVVGRPVERVEDHRFLTGSGIFIADLRREDLLYCAILRSPVAHARIRRMDTERAMALSGVVSVVTAADLAGGPPLIPLRQHAFPEGEPYRQPVIATGRVRYVGEPVAVVLANDLATANDALELIGLDLEEMPVVTDCKAAASGDVLLFDGTTGNSPIVFSAEMGNADKAFVEADYRRRERFSVQRHTACPMETRGLVADWDPARRRLIVHGAAKVPFYNRQILARMLAMEETEIDLMELDVGGGFGARGEFYPEDFLIPYAARRLQRPVRWVESRDEHFLATNHAREAYADVEIACMRDGRVVGLRGRFEVDNGAYVRTNGFTGPCNVALFMSGPYFVPNIALDAAVFMTNKPTVFSQVGRNDWRAADFVVESMC